jgi:hypothetical protein
MSTSFEAKALELAINKLFQEKHFSICQLDTIAELMGVNAQAHPNYKVLRALHCVDYSKMDSETREQLQHKVIECLRPQFNFSAAALTKALLMEGNDHIEAEDFYPLTSTKRLN